MTILKWMSVGRASPQQNLPLPLPDSIRVLSGASLEVVEVLQHTVHQTYMNLHIVEEHLIFFESIAAGTDKEMKSFLLYKRGPKFLIQGIYNWFSGNENDSMYVIEGLNTFTTLRNALAKFLAEIFCEIGVIGSQLIEEPRRTTSTYLRRVNGLLDELVRDIRRLTVHARVHDQLPRAEVIRLDVVKLLHNTQMVDVYVSSLVGKFGKPNRFSLHWIRYTCFGIGISLSLLWLLRHSAEVGHWTIEMKRTAIKYWKYQVLLLSSQLKNKREVNERRQEVDLSSQVLHRMLVAFSEKAMGEKSAKDTSTHKLLELVMGRYEKEFMYPIWYLVRGEIAATLLLQAQKLKLDIEEALLEMEEIRAVYQPTLVFMAALPTLLPLVIFMILGALFAQGATSENRRLARTERSFLLVQIGRDIERRQQFLEHGKVEDADRALGLLLYHLYSLYRAMRTPARATGQWISVRRDLLELGSPSTLSDEKQRTLSRMKDYDCFFL